MSQQESFLQWVLH